MPDYEFFVVVVEHLSHMDDIHSAIIIADIQQDRLSVGRDSLFGLSEQVENLYLVDEGHVNLHFVAGRIGEKDNFVGRIGNLHFDAGRGAASTFGETCDGIGFVNQWADGDGLCGVARRPKIVVGACGKQLDDVAVFDGGVVAALQRWRLIHG